MIRLRRLLDLVAAPSPRGRLRVGWVASDTLSAPKASFASLPTPVAMRIANTASWIPDNVDLAVFRGIREHRRRSPLRIVWSGMAEKGLPLVDVAAALRALPDAELVIVSNEPPEALNALASVARCTYVPFSLR